ncbi:hypothetical protein [Marixanthomonas spongiae]|uniref:Adhesin domain-containing protein n=1 Tax=Marixanthomonas spongiae TaxID=2174845 RepID=A0A2U0I2H1_9FLAO|nr:hypothetical protein [Marixanthomonas spongiae]PVW15298.1 hypothetical protein DDV96_07825 [Marixanthomonas spongiae]
MIKYIVTIVGVLLFSTDVAAQKLLEKQFNASAFETLVIESDDVFSIAILAEKTNTINVRTHIEGEHYESVVLNTSEAHKTLTLSTGYSPFFEKENDKLAAHKLIAIDMVVTVPENMNIEIRSKIASVTGSGAFENMFAALENGMCLLHNFKGNATLYTKQGAITVYAVPNVAGEAISKNGAVTNELPKTGRYKIKAESRTGAVTLLQNK